MSSFFEIFIVALLPLLGRGREVPDLLSLLDPQMALEALGEKTDEDSIRKLIEGQETAVGVAEAAYDKKEAESAIQNLASATESVREKARDKLAAIGPAIRARLDEVVAKDSRRADEAKKVLTTLDESKAASGQRKNAARQLAIRFAADKSLDKLVPSIREAQKAPDLFVARTAKEALAELEKSDAKPAEASKAPLSTAVEALPKGTGVLLAIETAGSPSPSKERMRLGDLMKEVMGSLPSGPPAEQIDKMLREVTQQVVQFAVAYGNIRPSSVYLANVGSVGPLGGGLAIIATGDYDRALLESGLEKNSALWTVGETAGRKLFTSVAARLTTLDDHTVLILPQVASKNFPLTEYLAALKDGKRTLRSAPRWDKFLETLKGGSAVLRGLAITDDSLMSEILKEIDSQPEVKPAVREAVKGMKELELDVAATEGTKVRWRLEGTFEEPDHAKNLVQFMKDSIQEGVSQMEQTAAQLDIPQIKTMLEMMKGIKVSAEAKKGILRMEVDLLTLLSGMGIATTPRAAGQ